MDYFKKIKYVLEQLWFDYLGVRYQGHGVMLWTPEEGFHIEAFLDKQPISQSKTIEFGKVGIIRKSDTSSIRMKPRGFDWAIAPNVPLINCLDIILNNQLSIDLHRVIFSESGGTVNKSSTWFGSTIYEIKNHSAISDFLNTDMRINAQRVSSISNGPRAWYEDEKNQRISGRMITEKHLELNWRLDNSLWSKTDSWKWSKAAQDALSIWFGEEVWLLQREVRRGVQTCTEIKISKKLGSLGFMGSKFSEARRQQSSGSAYAQSY